MKKRFFALLLSALMLFGLTACDSGDYKAAVKLLESGDYAAASAAFKALGDYEDSAAQAQHCDYQLALAALESGDYAAALAAFEALGSYEDSAVQAQHCDYQLARAALESGDYAAAVTAFEALAGYEDSGEYLLQAQDGLLRETLTGGWTYNYDVGGAATEFLGEELGELTGLPEFAMALELELKEDGTLILTVNEEKLRQDAEPFLDAVIVAMINLIAEESNMEPEELCEALEVASLEELRDMLKKEGGLNADAFVEEILTDDMYWEGDWSVENGAVSAVFNGETEELSYDSAADTIAVPSYEGEETIAFVRR